MDGPYCFCYKLNNFQKLQLLSNSLKVISMLERKCVIYLKVSLNCIHIIV